MKFLYSLGIFTYGLIIKLASLYNEKAKQWIKGRKNVFDDLKNFNPENKKVIWIHCASLGEFEQGRPVIESLKSIFPDKKILLTFFSPSGYEIRKNYALADLVTYMPLDSKANAKKFISNANPELAIFIKYEFWHHHYRELAKQNIPILLVSGVFRPGQIFFKGYGNWFRNTLRKVDHFFVQDNKSVNLLMSLGINQSTVSGDTRFDRVFNLRENAKDLPEIDEFTSQKPTIIFGSTWPADEEVISDFINSSPSEIKFIIAPHELSNDHLKDIEKNLTKKVIRYSNLSENSGIEYSILLIDNIGMLNRLYAYGDIAYIGGGFGSGIHNILEPATYGLPIIFGPNYKKFNEAFDLIEMEAAFSINDKESFEKAANKILNDKQFRLLASEKAKNYVTEKKGATEIIVKYTVNLLQSK